ncbi:PRC-barrel domain-containing protein [Actinomadura sp. ATCC 31491]|uniref:PRC-barrel domain-containing protein n=1 Tax=Actinomadura luzonensis TaxID=2805427 RepID=A0ABT0G4T6_9ACTN|nr:PRC-barrel domain-containing protein [Actinomadura luzonensis]MCK2219121.1 PRC-barrel domain-containing protein [Actinomadura luzonensis]
MATQTEIRTLLECHVVGCDGEPLGRVGQVYLNDHTGRAEWVTVRGGFLGMRQTFVPLAGSHRTAGEIVLAFDGEKVRTAPGVAVDGLLTAPEEVALYRHYGLGPAVPAPRTGRHDRLGLDI